MSQKIQAEYSELFHKLNQNPSSKMWKHYQKFILNLQETQDLDREDRFVLIRGLAEMGLFDDAFMLINQLEERNKKENKVWYELKQSSSLFGNNHQRMRYYTSRKFDRDRLLTKPFRDKIEKERAQKN